MKVAINGLGRVGRAFLKDAILERDLDIVAVNDLGDLENFAYLLRYDSAYGRLSLEVSVAEGTLIVNGKHITFLSEKDPSMLPWKKLGVDVVVESTGFFEDYGKAKAHLAAGARRVVISAPAKGDPETAGVSGGTVLMGANESHLSKCIISSNGSCTTNASSPVVHILKETIGIERALLNTVHGYTASQKLVDGPDSKDFRRGRAAAQNIVPSSTGAAVAVTQVATDLLGSFDGIAMRVPVISGSIVDITFVAKRDTSAEEINSILKGAAKTPRWQGIFTVSEEPIVSSDIVGRPEASIADLPMTRVVGNLVKVLAWYDNEMGYANTLVRHVQAIGKYL